MKKIFYILPILVLLSCKKDKKSSNQAIDTPTLNEMISNFYVPTEGHIEIETNISTDYYGNEVEGYNGFYIQIFDSIVSNKTIIKGKVIIDNRILYPDTAVLKTNAYSFYDDPNRDNIIKGLFGNRIINFKLFETDNSLVTEFNFKTPERLSMKASAYSVKPTSLDKEKITWNADPTNKIGLVMEYESDYFPFPHDVVFLADDGEESLKNVVGNYVGGINLKMYRGTIIVKTGTDGKKYKVICVARSTAYVRVE